MCIRDRQFIEDDDERETLPTIGYMAYFEYLNGFRKDVYKRQVNIPIWVCSIGSSICADNHR